MRQIHLFLSVSTLVITYYVLSFWADPVASKTVVAFTIMFMMSWLSLAYMKQYYKLPDGAGFPVDWDEDLDRRGLGLCLLSTLGIFVVSIAFTGIFSRAVLYVPEAKALGVLETGSTLTTQILNELLYQTFIVSAGEESLKLSVIVGLTLMLQHSRNAFLRSRCREVGALIPIGFWAFLHAMIAYSNIYMTVAAFAAGVILFWLLLRLKSLLGVILTHAWYNTIVRVVSLLA